MSLLLLSIFTSRVLTDSYKSQVELGTLLRRVLVVMEAQDVQGHAMPPDYQNFILRQVLGHAITLPPYP